MQEYNKTKEEENKSIFQTKDAFHLTIHEPPSRCFCSYLKLWGRSDMTFTLTSQFGIVSKVSCGQFGFQRINKVFVQLKGKQKEMKVFKRTRFLYHIFS